MGMRADSGRRLQTKKKTRFEEGTIFCRGLVPLNLRLDIEFTQNSSGRAVKAKLGVRVEAVPDPS